MAMAHDIHECDDRERPPTVSHRAPQIHSERSAFVSVI